MFNVKKILIVEDCAQTQKILEKIFEPAEASVRRAGSFAEGKAAITTDAPDMVLLDLALPDGDGFDLLSEIRNDPATAATAVIFITGKQETAIKVAAFSLGVDDYIVKPFELTELKARLQSKLKKLCHKSAKENLLLVGDLQIDLASQQVNDLSDNKRALKLTSREFKLLVFFAQNENHVLSRERLLDAVWGSNATTVFDRTIDTHISAIRKKLGKHSSYIESVKGSGYRLRRGGRRNTA